jgi:hypothetical protein
MDFGSKGSKDRHRAFGSAYMIDRIRQHGPQRMSLSGRVRVEGHQGQEQGRIRDAPPDQGGREVGGKLHRHYCGLHVGTNNVLILFSSSNESLFDTNLKEVQKLVDSWDASGVFPAANKQEEK